MNAATAMREFRRLLAKEKDRRECYELYKRYFTYNELSLIHSDDIRYSIIIYLAESKDRNILKFVNMLSDEEFDMDRYKQYTEFRQKNKFDSSSVEFYKVKFGDTWYNHYKKAKEERFNMYSVEDYMNRYGLTKNEAELQVKGIKEKTTNTLEKYIEKYGKEVGEEKFFQSFRRHKNYIEYWLKKYPDNKSLAYEKFKEYTTSSNRYHVNFYLKRGYDKEEAVQIISKLQRTTAGVHREFYECNGFDEEEIDSIMSTINAKKDSSSIEYILSKNDNLKHHELIEIYEKLNNSKSSTYRELGYRRTQDPNLDKRISYYEKVYYYTRLSIKFIEPCPGDRGRYKDQYHLDHIYSITEGYANNIPPQIIGHMTNLRWVKASENCSKRGKCLKTKQELIKEYEEYENNKD